MELLLISDIHGNLEALDAALSIPHDRAICLGDVVDYGPDPGRCIDRLRDEGISCVMGNHDNAVARGIDCGCGYTYKHLSVATRKYTLDVLDDGQLEFLRGLPFSLKEDIDGIRFLFTHAGPLSMYDYIRPDTSDESVIEMLGEVDAGSVDMMVAGHSHVRLDRLVAGVRIVNPGSVGQRRDGGVGASCAILDTLGSTVEFFDVDYDVRSVIGKLEERMPCSDELVAILRRRY
ncbi:metallophosphoesterase family protein [Methanococcoides sp. SA1]|nr:metallophosphoesterase family protein [Methanococcoides sp. SA1]